MNHHTLVSVIGKYFKEIPNHPAQRHKLAGQWVDVSYADLGKATYEIAAGLRTLGMKKGDRVSLLCQNRVEWAWCDLGIFFNGCVVVTIYPTSIASEVAYILDNSESRVIFVEDQKQLEKVIESKAELPKLEKVILISGSIPKQSEWVISLEELRKKGREQLNKDPSEQEQISASIKPDDIMAIIYTSGTTGPPKGVQLNHRNILFVIDSVFQALPNASELQINLSFLPLSHALERVGGHFAILAQGRTVGYAESMEKISENFREIQPDFATAVPRVFEKVYARIQDKLKNSSLPQRLIFQWAATVGKETLPFRLEGKPLPLALQLKSLLADRLVFSKIRAVLGGRLKYFVSGGAPLDAKIAEFFFSMGIAVLEGWGATESSAPATINLPKAVKLGSVGRPIKGVEVKVAEDGELLIKGPNVCQGYWKMPEENTKTFDSEGWYHTGDIGHIDEDGFVFITDRKKELIITSAGKNISPQKIENKLKLCPYISNAMSIGDKRNYITALITLDCEIVAKQLGLQSADHLEFSKRQDVNQLIESEIQKVNQELPRFEQIKKFRIAPQDFSIEHEELSPTLKLKRKQIITRYRDLIESLYAN